MAGCDWIAWSVPRPCGIAPHEAMGKDPSGQEHVAHSPAEIWQGSAVHRWSDVAADVARFAPQSLERCADGCAIHGPRAASCTISAVALASANAVMVIHL